ncbi:MAG: glycosyltransferase [Candidatus Peribacteraceae bacterium]|nr:glycosyltransferase [Candidatus Peribacteraceae bacterium]
MSTPALSIVIPTYSRGEILRECLKRIEAQTIRDRIEVIAVSDGEPDKETAHLAKESFQVPVTFLAIPKSQQGAARNKGVQQAKGAVTLFLGDDMFPEPECCETHLRRHGQIDNGKLIIDNDGSNSRPKEIPKIINYQLSINHPSAILGHVTWDPALDITPVMRWLEKTGWQFGFSFLQPHAFVPADKQHRFTYTANISLPTAIARKVPFKEGINLYGWEDVEWGMRLREAGAHLFYEPDAKVLHHHRITLEDSLKRMETLGTSAVLFERMAPDMHIVPKGWKRLAYGLIAYLPTMRGRHAGAFLKGCSQH